MYYFSATIFFVYIISTPKVKYVTLRFFFWVPQFFFLLSIMCKSVSNIVKSVYIGMMNILIISFSLFLLMVNGYYFKKL